MATTKKKKPYVGGKPLATLPSFVIDNYGWHEKAACQGENTELFFYDENERGLTKDKKVKAAKAICSSCPVIKECLQWALATKEPAGIWGGTTPEERGIRII